MTPLYFVHFQQPGQVSSLQDVKESRKHTRKFVLRHRRCNNMEKIKQIKFQDPSVGTASSENFIAEQMNRGPKPHGEAEYTLQNSMSWVRKRQTTTLDDLGIRVSIKHPYTVHAAPFVHLNVDRIDELFKSRKLRDIK